MKKDIRIDYNGYDHVAVSVTEVPNKWKELCEAEVSVKDEKTKEDA